MGIPFCLASFVTYTTIGFGLLRALHALTGFEVVRFWLEIGMMILLGVFAYLSFRDAYRFKKSGNPEDVALQMPDSMKLRIHRIIRDGIGVGSLAVGGLVIGTLVTAIESICTGQVYVPTLVLVIRNGAATDGFGLTPTAWRYLVAYNVMFIVPLVLVFLLTYIGLRTRTLLDWSRKNVVLSKILLGVFFLAMAALIGLM